MRCVSWNVNGIRAVHRKERLPWDVVVDADVVCVQETKARAEQVPPEVAEPEGFASAEWFSAQKPGYSSVATFCRQAPDEVVVGMDREEFDAEGRVLTVRFGRVHIVNAYFPNSQDGGRRLGYKLAFCDAMEDFLERLRADGGETLLVGDYNIAHTEIDLARPKQNEESPGYLPEERAWMTRYLGLGYHDVFREEHPGLVDAYTWWSYRGRARENNVGWRIDYTTVSPGLRSKVKAVEIHADVDGSDHCPISIDLKRGWKNP